MEQRSQYLARALQQMAPQQGAAAFQQPPAAAPAKRMDGQARQSIFATLKGAGQNLRQAPARTASNLGSLFGLGWAARGG